MKKVLVFLLLSVFPLFAEDKWPELGYGIGQKELPYLQNDPLRYQCGTEVAVQPKCVGWSEAEWVAAFPDLSRRNKAKAACKPTFRPIWCKKNAAGVELRLRQWIFPWPPRR